MTPRQIRHSDYRTSRGISLIELMITIAIISILAGIAIPLYNGYVREGHLAAMRTNMNGLRTVIEDYRLDNGNYGATGNLVGLPAIEAVFDWEPSGDMSAYTYTVAVTATNSYDVWGIFIGDNTIWVRCDNRFQTCCSPPPSTPGTLPASCP